MKLADTEQVEYAGFWIRVWASIIDSVLLVCVILPLLLWIYGWEYLELADSSLIAGPADFLVSWVMPAVAVIAFWLYKQATPGKMLVHARVVDAKTGNTLTTSQSVIRYLGYFVSAIPFCLGLIWVAFDPRKQGWHDKLAGTVVIRSRHRGPEPVVFDKS
ncbi:MAG: RDD family protein [Gammaproteobacteria bacterium]|nr:RDD family protein [Gammaproteobacteria bacterium]